MNRKSRTVVRTAVVVAVSSGLSFTLSVPARADATPAYSHDASIGLTNTDWMSRLPDATLLSGLSIPGTHDTGSYVAGGDIALTQSMSLDTQLNSGVRAWDIRLAKDSSGRLKIYHGPIQQGQDFQTDVLGTADRFLAAHAGETVLMRIQEEQTTANFAAAVQAGLDADPRVYRGTSNNPTLRDIRGKIVVLQNFTSATRLGIPWSGLTIQDNYQLNTNWDLADKWHAIQAQLDKAAAGPAGTTYVNFLSGSGGSFPYFVASGHSSPGTSAPNLLTGLTRGIINTCQSNAKCIPEYPNVNCFLGTCSVAFQGTNILTMQKIDSQNTTPHRYGIIYADFPGAGLIRAIIRSTGVSAHAGH